MKNLIKALKFVLSKNTLALCMFASLFCLAPVNVSTSRAVLETDTWGVQKSLKEGDSKTKFTNLYKAVKGFAGVLLLIGCVLSAIFFVMGNTKIAILVFGGAVLLYGGAYLIGIAAEAFT